MNIRLRKSREAFGFTQAHVAKKAGITKLQYLRIEHEKSKPRKQTAIRIADALATTVEALFGQ